MSEPHWRAILRPSAARAYRWFRPESGRLEPEVFDAEYAAGEWGRLDTIGEMAHYMVALGYLSFGVSHPAVLDVGCGHGRLLQLLEPFGFKEYLGVDYSAEAIRRAESLSIANTRFEVADFEAWDTQARFDVVMLHECLYYSRDPRRVFERALGWLTSDGMLALSMFSNPHATRIWSQLETVPIRCLGWTTVTDRQTGNVWDVKAVQSVSAPGPARL